MGSGRKKLNARNPERVGHKNKMSASKIDYTKKTIVFRRIDEFELDYAEWYYNKKDDFKTDADALAQWKAMVDGTDGKAEERENEEEFGWEQVEEQCDEIQQEYETDCYDEEMTDTIDEVFEAFEKIGVKCYKDHSCCNTCGHAEAEAKNYVFYHGQDTEGLRKGDRSVHLAFNFDDETKVKVLEMIEKQTCDAIRLHWAGGDHTKIFLSCDDDEMAKHIQEDIERQKRMEFLEEKRKQAEIRKADEKAARRVALLKELAELDKE